MWCDTFDADLLKVVPGAAEALGAAAAIPLFTYSELTGGQINHPACWNTDRGFAALFWTVPMYRPLSSYSTAKPVARCTFLEAVRDEWVHNCLIVVDRRPVWRPRHHWLELLMYDVRGQRVLEEAERETTRQTVRDSLQAAASALLELVAS